MGAEGRTREAWEAFEDIEIRWLQAKMASQFYIGVGPSLSCSPEDIPRMLRTRTAMGASQRPAVSDSDVPRARPQAIRMQA